jgi:dienelactone hydrolase
LPSPVNGNVAAWTYRGKPLLAPIALNRIRGPVFAAGGGGDALTPSGSYVEEMERELRGHDRRDVMLVYPHAGHALGAIVPNQSTPTTVDSIYGPLVLGGSPQADEAAREDSWPRLLRFLAKLSA